MLNEFVVDGGWVQANLGRRELVIVDCDPEAAYLRAHIPGALHSNKHPYKSSDNHRVVMGPPEFGDAMSELGIGDDTEVIAYDTSARSPPGACGGACGTTGIRGSGYWTGAGTSGYGRAVL